MLNFIFPKIELLSAVPAENEPNSLINKAFYENTLRRKDFQPIDLKGKNALAGIDELLSLSYCL